MINPLLLFTIKPLMIKKCRLMFFYILENLTTVQVFYKIFCKNLKLNVFMSFCLYWYIFMSQNWQTKKEFLLLNKFVHNTFKYIVKNKFAYASMCIQIF